jgi:hypothetical protein
MDRDQLAEHLKFAKELGFLAANTYGAGVSGLQAYLQE